MQQLRQSAQLLKKLGTFAVSTALRPAKIISQFTTSNKSAVGRPSVKTVNNKSLFNIDLDTFKSGVYGKNNILFQGKIKQLKELFFGRSAAPLATINVPEDILELRKSVDPSEFQDIEPSNYYLSIDEESLIIVAAYCSNAAYCNSIDELNKVLSDAKTPGGTQIFPNGLENLNILYDSTSPTFVEGFCGYSSDLNIVILSFRGTDLMSHDTITDANAFETKEITEINGNRLFVPISGHLGFLNRLRNIAYPALDALVKAYEAAFKGSRNSTTIPKLLITGHSLGGALANGAAFILCQLIPNLPIQLITMDAPRTFTTQTVQKIMLNTITKNIEEHAIRISALYDFVPNVPTMGMDFRHVGRNYHIKNPLGETYDKRHSMDNILNGLLRDLGDEDLKQFLKLTNGRGVTKTRKSKKSSLAMKKKMAYVRSFKRH